MPTLRGRHFCREAPAGNALRTLVVNGRIMIVLGNERFLSLLSLWESWHGEAVTERGGRYSMIALGNEAAD